MKRRITTLLTILTLVMVFVSSCKDPVNPDATITIVDGDGKAVQGAVVTVQPNTEKTSFIKDVQISDASGRTYHKFDYEGILNVTAQKTQAIYAADADTFATYIYEGQGILILEYDKTYDEVITLRSYY